MKILHIRATNFYGGPERQLHLHAKQAVGSGFEVIVATFLEPGGVPDLIRRCSDDGIGTHVFDVSSAYDFRALSMIRGFIRDNGIDVLCTHDYRSTVYGWCLSRRGSLRWVAFSRGFTDTNLKVRIYQGLEKRLSRHADAVVAVSGAQADKMRALGVPERKLFPVLNAIDVSASAAAEPVDLHRRFDLPEDAVLCVSAGRFSREKGQEVLVHAAAAALRRQPQLRFILFGDGSDTELITGLVRELGLEKEVLCPGFERNVLGCFKGADIVVNPSWSEGMPNVVLEGMAQAVPVVATAVGGVPEVIEDGVTGVLLPAGDVDGLADAFVELANDPERRRRIGDAGQDFARTNCTFEAQFEAMADVYRRFASGARA